MCWLLVQELNSRGSHLLFRDKAHQLHLFNLATQQRSSLLSFCQYVQWVPGSDVVVAQSRNKLCVWYNINSPDRCGARLGTNLADTSCGSSPTLLASENCTRSASCLRSLNVSSWTTTTPELLCVTVRELLLVCMRSATMVPIKGDVEGIERAGGRTEVLVTEGLTTVSYTLDEALVTFDTALKERVRLIAAACTHRVQPYSFLLQLHNMIFPTSWDQQVAAISTIEEATLVHSCQWPGVELLSRPAVKPAQHHSGRAHCPCCCRTCWAHLPLSSPWS